MVEASQEERNVNLYFRHLTVNTIETINCRGNSGHREAACCIAEIQVREIGGLNQVYGGEHHHAEDRTG